MKTFLAKVISIIGHPLLTIPVFVIVVLFSGNDSKSALFLTFLIIGCVFIPIISWIYLKSKNGSYSNFDVSDQKQRRSLFVFAIPFLAVITVVLFATHQPVKTSICMLFATILVVISQLVNFYIKSSLHVSLTLYLAFIALHINFIFGITLIIMSFFIGWSRIILKRHSLKEVFAGAIIGLSVGSILFYFLTLNV